MSQEDDTPPLRGHHPHLQGARPEDQARNAAALREAIAANIFADEAERQREQEEQDEAGREEAERWGRMWGNNEASMDCE